MPPPVTLKQATRVWALVGLQSFGGPAGQIAVMHRVLVEEKKWLSEARFLHALNYCMLLPGPEAMQLVTYAGWLLHRTTGGLIAGALFVLPGFLSILALSLAYVAFKDLALMQGLLLGLKAAVLAIVAQALWRIARRALKNPAMVTVAIAAFVAIFFFEAPFPLIILAAALIGLAGARIRPDWFIPREKPDVLEDGSLLGDALPDHARPHWLGTLRTAIAWLLIWLAPVVGLLLTLGPRNIFAQEAVFFSIAATVTFGGAYAVLAFITHHAVEVHHWLEKGEMLVGLGLAETTPGPLIQVVQFVGFMGAYRDPSPLNPYAAAVLASALVTWVTFAPCFLWIFVGAPYIEALRSKKSLAAALSAITASVVGVILNLALFFFLHVLFREAGEIRQGPLKLLVPEPTSVDPLALAIAAAAFILIFVARLSMLPVLAICAVAGALIHPAFS